MARHTHLKAALKDNSHLRDLVQSSMGAFISADVKLVTEDRRTEIGDSLDLDSASREEHPEANRWDYIVSLPEQKKFAGIEPHSAKDDQVSVVIAKKKHATTYLRSHLKAGYRISRWYWVSHGKVSFSRMDRARRRLDQNGITFVGRIIRTFT